MQLRKGMITKRIIKSITNAQSNLPRKLVFGLRETYIVKKKKTILNYRLMSSSEIRNVDS